MRSAQSDNQAIGGGQAKRKLFEERLLRTTGKDNMKDNEQSYLTLLDDVRELFETFSKNRFGSDPVLKAKFLEVRDQVFYLQSSPPRPHLQN